MLPFRHAASKSATINRNVHSVQWNVYARYQIVDVERTKLSTCSECRYALASLYASKAGIAGLRYIMVGRALLTHLKVSKSLPA